MTAADRPVVAVTRDERTDDRFSRRIEAAGGRALPLATVAIEPPADDRALVTALGALDTVDWIVFTSAHAVEATCGRPEWEVSYQRGRGRIRLAAVGEVTADRLRARGLHVDLLSGSDSRARELVAAFLASTPLDGVRVLWPRSDVARRELPEALAAQGAVVMDPVAYRTVAIVPPALPEFLSLLAENRLAAVALMSPSAARGLASALPGGALTALAGRTLVASLGPTTSEAIRELGGRVDLESPERSATSLADALMRQLAARHGDAA